MMRRSAHRHRSFAPLRIGTIALLAVLCISLVACSSSDGDGTSGAGPPLFQSVRHADTATLQVARVAVEQIAGPPVRSGRVVYRQWVLGDIMAEVVEGESPLQPMEGTRVWTGQIPLRRGPAGVEVEYHFVFESADGHRIVHPRRAERNPDSAGTVRYRFRAGEPVPKVWLIPLRPRASGTPVEVGVVADFPGDPRGAVLFRRNLGEWIERALEARPASGGEVLLSARLPAVQAGDVVDFKLRLGGVYLPSDERFFTYKVRGEERTWALTASSQVTALASGCGGTWIGSNGGGLWLVSPEPQSPPRRWTTAEGLPSNQVRALACDLATGTLFVGTANGLVALQTPSERQGSIVPMAGPPFSWLAPEGQRVVNVTAVSPFGGEIVAELASEQADLLSPFLNVAHTQFSLGSELASEEADPALPVLDEDSPPNLLEAFRDSREQFWAPPGVRLIEISRGRAVGRDLQSWRPRTEAITAAYFDETEGCRYLATKRVDPSVQFMSFAQPPEESSLFWVEVEQNCGGRWEVTRIPSVPTPSGSGVPSRVVAFARDVVSGELVLALRYWSPAAVRPRQVYTGIFILRNGQLTPLAPELESLAPAAASEGDNRFASVTALLPDPAHSRLLVATFGEGILAFSARGVERIGLAHGLPSERVTALAAGPTRGKVLVGTVAGPAVLHEDSTVSRLPVPGEVSDVELASAKITDVLAPQGRLLAVAEPSTLLVIEARSDEPPRIERTVRIPAELGKLRAAIFDGGADRLFVAAEQGVALLEDDKIERIELPPGLPPALRLESLTRHPRTAHVWMVFYEGAGRGSPNGWLQLWRDGPVGPAQSVPRDVLPLREWLFVPERNAMLALAPSGVVVEFRADASLRQTWRLPENVLQLARDTDSGQVWALGSQTLYRWSEDDWLPLPLPPVQHPRVGDALPPESARKLDFAVRSTEEFWILLEGGFLAAVSLSGAGRILDWEDGIPRSADTLWWLPASEVLVMGSRTEGVVALSPPPSP